MRLSTIYWGHKCSQRDRVSITIVHNRNTRFGQLCTFRDDRGSVCCGLWGAAVYGGSAGGGGRGGGEYFVVGGWGGGLGGGLGG